MANRNAKRSVPVYDWRLGAPVRVDLEYWMKYLRPLRKPIDPHIGLVVLESHPEEDMALVFDGRDCNWVATTALVGSKSDRTTFRTVQISRDYTLYAAVANWLELGYAAGSIARAISEHSGEKLYRSSVYDAITTLHRMWRKRKAHALEGPRRNPEWRDVPELPEATITEDILG